MDYIKKLSEVMNNETLKAHNFSINLMKKYDEMLYLQHKMIYNHRKKKMFSSSVANIIERVFNMHDISLSIIQKVSKY